MIQRLRISGRSKAVARGQRLTLADVCARARISPALKSSGAMIAFAHIVAQPACAQILTSSAEIARYEDKARGENAVEIRRMVDCAVGRTKDRMALLITTMPGSNDEIRLMYSLRNRMTQCMKSLRTVLLADATEVRAAISEKFYVETYKVDPDFSRVAHPEAPLPDSWIKKEYSKPQASLMFGHEMGRCLAAANPEAAAAIVRSQPRSAEERTAIKKLKPSIGPCVVQGNTLSLDMSALRAFVSQEYYRSVQAWAPPASSPVGGVN